MHPHISTDGSAAADKHVTEAIALARLGVGAIRLRSAAVSVRGG